jgi:hypothetical protein
VDNKADIDQFKNYSEGASETKASQPTEGKKSQPSEDKKPQPSEDKKPAAPKQPSSPKKECMDIFQISTLNIH